MFRFLVNNHFLKDPSAPLVFPAKLGGEEAPPPALPEVDLGEEASSDEEEGEGESEGEAREEEDGGGGMEEEVEEEEEEAEEGECEG